jgi:hypothetical protein
MVLGMMHLLTTAVALASMRSGANTVHPRRHVSGATTRRAARTSDVSSTAVIDRGLADLVVAVHLAYIVFIPVGGFLAWRWPRLIPFHLAAVAAAVISVTINYDCPLTGWEKTLRRHGGERPYRNGFVDHYLTGRVYPHGSDRVVQLFVLACIVVSYAHIVRKRRRARASA